MLDHVAAREAFRERAQTLVVATTGTMALASTSQGFTRASGSFLDDGFAAGMEVVGTGYPGSIGSASIIDKAEAQLLTIVGGRTATASAGSRSLTVGLPASIDWQGTINPYPDRPATRPRFRDEWVPGTMQDSGAIIDTGFYVLTWLGLADKGIVATFRQMQALRDLFPPGWFAFVGSDEVRVTGNPAPTFTAPVTLDNGYEMSQLRVPWRAVTTNLDAA